MIASAVYPRPWELRTRTLTRADRALIMGVVNVTPDSFSDGGSCPDHDSAVEHALRLVRAGADLIDVGGESTRPGSRGVATDEESTRAVPVVASLAARGVAVSIDTSKPAVAAAALRAGAEVVNDISGLRSAEMRAIVADAGAGVVIMHMQGTPRTMQSAPNYEDVVGVVEDFLLTSADAAMTAGIKRERIAIDPGIGFGKTVAHTLALLAATPRLAAHGFPVLLGHSRKHFLGVITGIQRPADRDGASAALSALLAFLGASAVRVHDVEATQSALLTAAAIVRRSTALGSSS